MLGLIGLYQFMLVSKVEFRNTFLHSYLTKFKLRMVCICA